MSDISYELAKELHDAGYPQVLGEGRFEGHLEEAVYVPTLAELIEACPKQVQNYGRNFDFGLRYQDGKWLAFYSDEDYHETYEQNEFGPTPEEAVARLWLAPNKK